MPSHALSEIWNLPRPWPSRLVYASPLGKRDFVRIFGGHRFWSAVSGRSISEHILTDAIWRAPIHHIPLGFQNLILKYATIAQDHCAADIGLCPFPPLPTWWIEVRACAYPPSPVLTYLKTNLGNNEKKNRLSPSGPVDLIQNWMFCQTNKESWANY